MSFGSIANYSYIECTGCNACVASCNKQAITTQVDSNGFWYPHVNAEKCIGCGLCVKSCPLHGELKTSFFEPSAYAAWNENEPVRKMSSSGGLFSAIASLVIEKKGVVYGAAYTDDFMVHHIRISKEEEIKKLRGSKYIQSYISQDIYNQLREDIQYRLVLFSGTPCQTAAVIKYIEAHTEESIRDNLLTIDLLCHGVPSPKSWKEYLNEMTSSKPAKLVNVNMRDKSTGWHRFQIKLEFDDGSEYYESYHEGIWGPCYYHHKNQH